MSFAQRLAALFNVYPGEEQSVFLFILYYFFLSIGINFTLSAGFALFVAEFGSQQLPFAYITIAILVTLMGYVYLRLAERLHFRRLVAVNITFLAVVSVLIWSGLSLANPQWLKFLLPVWFQGLVTLANLAFWSMAGGFFDVRQSKRLFGLIASGNWIAATVAGFLIPLIVQALGVNTLYPLAGAALVAALVVQRRVFRMRPEPASAAPENPRPAARPAPSAQGLFQNHYILMIFALVVVWWLGFYFLDNIFYDRAAAQFADANQLTSAIGTLLGLEGILALFTSFFLSSRLTARYGLRAGLLIVPIILLLAVGGLALLGTIDRTLAALFWLAALAKLVSVAMGFSIDQSTRLVLYQPLPDALRVRTLTLSDGIVQSLAIGLAGVALLVFNTLLSFRAVELSYVFLLIVVGWIASVLLLLREYPKVLAGALRKRLLGDSAPLELADSSTLSVIRVNLDSPYPETVIYAMNLLRQTGYGAFARVLPTLLSHPAPEVRREALRHIEEMGLRSSYEAVESCLQNESDMRVGEAALRTLAAISDGGALDVMTRCLDAPELLLRRGALIGLLRYTGLEGILAAGQRLLTMLNSPEADERLLAVQVLGEIGIQNFNQLLMPLFNDDHMAVRAAAVAAAGKIRHPQLWPEVIRALEMPALRNVAAQALVQGGDEVLPVIRIALEHDSHTSREVTSQLVRICGRMHSSQVIPLLRDKLDYVDPAVRTLILDALVACGYHALDNLAVQQQIRSEAADAAWILTARRDVGSGVEVDLLTSALDYQFEQIRARIFDLMAFLYEPKTLERARYALVYGAGNQRAYALEIVDSLLPADLKSWVLPLLDDFTVAQRLQKLVPLFPQTSLDRAKRLSALAHDPRMIWYPWLRACTLYTIGGLGLHESADAPRNALNAGEAVVREAAAWALAQLGQSAVKGKGDSWMLSTIEKVIILRTVSIFAGIPDEVLAEVASIVEEVEFRGGEPIFEKGDLGDSMYVIGSGQVRVHDGDRTLNLLGEREVFGEMALLDPEPRVASVTAVEDTRVFRLGQEAFYELIENYGEVARGIIRVLAGHLRARVRDVAELHSRVQQLEQSATVSR